MSDGRYLFIDRVVIKRKQREELKELMNQYLARGGKIKRLDGYTEMRDRKMPKGNFQDPFLKRL